MEHQQHGFLGLCTAIPVLRPEPRQCALFAHTLNVTLSADTHTFNIALPSLSHLFESHLPTLFSGPRSDHVLRIPSGHLWDRHVSKVRQLSFLRCNSRLV